MLLRLTAALMFVSAGGMIGMHFSYKLKLRREVCREIEYLLRCCEIYIRCNAMNVYEITGHLCRDPELSHLDFISRLPEEFSEGINFHDEWRRALASQEMPQEERQILAEFGDILGTSDISGQLSSIASLSERIRQLEAQRREICLKKSRMYRSIGVLFGVMVGILVI